ncbi:phasin family protein [Sphingomonas humi]|uniref:Phasin domain-containing protein n=1 Tax=Sphingomonas humi TaxID=335630 RepID=A0ABP7REK7_9SPHN
MTDNVNDETFTAAAETAEPVEASVVEAVKKVNARRVKTERKPRARKAAGTTNAPRGRKAAAAATQDVSADTAAAFQPKENVMNFDPTSFTSFQPFANLPGADRFQTLFADAGSRGQEVIEKGRKTAEDFAELTRANVDAAVEAGKIAASGAKTVGEDALQRVRQGLEQNVAEFKTLAQASSPTEFFQLQSEIAKQNFDRMVASLSQLTEASVKLAGEAIQPLSNRAALNAEKLNELTA